MHSGPLVTPIQLVAISRPISPNASVPMANECSDSRNDGMPTTRPSRAAAAIVSSAWRKKLVTPLVPSSAAT